MHHHNALRHTTENTATSVLKTHKSKIFTTAIRASLLGAAMLLAGCSAGPSDTEVAGCVLDAMGHDDFNQEVVHMAPMGIEASRSTIDAIYVDNLVKEDANSWVAYVSISLGLKPAWLPEDATEAAAMFSGGEVRDGYIFQDIDAEYLFLKGTKGFICEEL